jgi:hypothetical protein
VPPPERVDLLHEVVERFVAGLRSNCEVSTTSSGVRCSEEEVLIRLVHFLDVVGSGRALAFGLGARWTAVSAAPRWGLEMMTRSGGATSLREQIVEPLIDEELVIVQVQIREDLVLVEDVIGNRQLAEKIGLPHRRLLAVPVEQIEQLGLERGARPIRVEIGQERVVVVFEDDVASNRVPSRSASAVLPTPIGPSTAMWRKCKGPDDIIATDAYLRRADTCSRCGGVRPATHSRRHDHASATADAFVRAEAESDPQVRESARSAQSAGRDSDNNRERKRRAVARRRAGGRRRSST